MFYLTHIRNMCGNPFHWRRGLYKNGWWFQYQDRSIHSILAMALGKRFVSWPYEKNRGGLHAQWSMKVARQKRSEICAVRVAKSKKNDLFWEHFFPDQKATKHWKGCHFFQHVDAPTRAIPHPAGCIYIYSTHIYRLPRMITVGLTFSFSNWDRSNFRPAQAAPAGAAGEALDAAEFDLRFGRSPAVEGVKGHLGRPGMTRSMSRLGVLLTCSENRNHQLMLS